MSGSKGHPWKNLTEKYTRKSRDSFQNFLSNSNSSQKEGPSKSKEKLLKIQFLINFHFSYWKKLYWQYPVTYKCISYITQRNKEHSQASKVQHPETLSSPWEMTGLIPGSSQQETTAVSLKYVFQRRDAELVKRLERKSYERHLRRLGLFSPGEEAARGGPYHSLQSPVRRL